MPVGVPRKTGAGGTDLKPLTTKRRFRDRLRFKQASGGEVSQSHSLEGGSEGDKREKLYAKGVAAMAEAGETPLPLGYKRRTRRERRRNAIMRSDETANARYGRWAVLRGEKGPERGKWRCGETFVSPLLTCLLLLKTGAWHRHFKWMKVTVRVT